MRNLIWLCGVLCCIAVGSRFHPQPATIANVASEKSEEFALLWQEWGTIPNEVFVFRGNGQGSQVFVPTYRVTKPEINGPAVTELFQKLRPEVEAALEEPCRGPKTKELTLIDGATSRTVEIGTYAGPAQARIVELMEKSGMPSLRSRLQRELIKS